jgi:hypothetical protein
LLTKVGDVLTSGDRWGTMVGRFIDGHIVLKHSGVCRDSQGRLSTQTSASIAREQVIPVRSDVRCDIISSRRRKRTPFRNCHRDIALNSMGPYISTQDVLISFSFASRPVLNVVAFSSTVSARTINRKAVDAYDRNRDLRSFPLRGRSHLAVESSVFYLRSDAILLSYECTIGLGHERTTSLRVHF